MKGRYCCGILITGGSWCKNLKNRVSLLNCQHLDNKFHSRLFNIAGILVVVLFSCFTHLAALRCTISILLIKMSGSESRGQKEAACASHQAYATTTVSYYTDDSSKFLKCCSSAAATAIT